MAELNVSLVVFREIDFLNVTNTYWDSDMLLDVFDVDEKQNILNNTKVIMIQCDKMVILQIILYRVWYKIEPDILIWPSYCIE